MEHGFCDAQRTSSGRGAGFIAPLPWSDGFDLGAQMNHLRELLDSDTRNMGRQSLMSADDALDFHEKFCATAPQAMCFFMGEVDDVAGITSVQELSSQMPYRSCWFECRVSNDGLPPLLISGLVHTLADGSLRLYMYHRNRHKWSMRAVAEMSDIWDTKFRALPNDNNTGMAVALFIEIVRSFLTAMNCSNIERAKNEPPSKLQKARAKRGDLPLFTYWTLQLKGKAEAGPTQGGTHTNPRLHLCRGHIKRKRSAEPPC